MLALPCEYASVDVLDLLGTNKVNMTKNIVKVCSRHTPILPVSRYGILVLHVATRSASSALCGGVSDRLQPFFFLSCYVQTFVGAETLCVFVSMPCILRVVRSKTIIFSESTERP